MRLHKLFLGSTALVSVVALAVPAFAQTLGRIALQGRVPARARVIMPSGPVLLAVEAAPESAPTDVTRLRLGSIANTPSGVVVKLASDNPAAENEPALTADDGTRVPYGVMVDGQAVAFSEGEAHLATVTREQTTEGTEVQIVAPKIARAATQAFSDHLVLVITAR